MSESKEGLRRFPRKSWEKGVCAKKYRQKWWLTGIFVRDSIVYKARSKSDPQMLLSEEKCWNASIAQRSSVALQRDALGHLQKAPWVNKGPHHWNHLLLDRCAQRHLAKARQHQERIEAVRAVGPAEPHGECHTLRPQRWLERVRLYHQVPNLGNLSHTLKEIRVDKGFWWPLKSKEGTDSSEQIGCNWHNKTYWGSRRPTNHDA